MTAPKPTDLRGVIQFTERELEALTVTELWHTAVMDPPWQERGGGRVKRGADRHYPLLSAPDVYRVVASSPLWTPAANAHLYMWVTDNFLIDGLRLMVDFGFRYVRTVVWIKTAEHDLDALEVDDLQTGLGQYFRGAHELCLFGVRGDGYAVRTDARDIKSVLPALRGRHSAKPASFYELVESRSRGPYAEFFARSSRPGWRSFGNEIANVEARP